MRTSIRLAILAGFFACQASPAVTVTHLRSGIQPDATQGDPIKLRRGAQEAYAGVHGGFFVVRSPEDWRALWPVGKEPPLPPTLDTSRQMLLVAMAESKDTVAIKMTKAFDAGAFIHVFVKETAAGENCVERPDRPPFDAVVVDRIDKPVKFWVEDDRGESCGAPPTPEVKCRVGEGAQWATSLSASPGDTIDCEMSAVSHGKFEVIDRSLVMGELPGGSAAKLAYSKGPTRGTFLVDVFGKYVVKGEAVDDGGRRGAGFANVEVLPPKTKDVLVQLVWTNFDASDDPETFPRTKLVAEEPATAKGQKPRTCAVDSPAPFCEVKHKSAYTIMKLKAGDKKLPLTVTYVDERIEKGPLVCIQLYFEGARTGEICDRQHRDPDSKWAIGDVDLTTGKLVDKSAIADAGADAAADASVDAAPPKK